MAQHPELADLQTLKALQQQLPFLPGTSFDLHKLALPHHRKSHAFDYCNQVSVFKEEKPGIGGTPLPGQDVNKVKTSVSAYPHSHELGASAPAWVVFDRKVLRFYAYFQEAVHERREEQYRIRKVNIYFYLEDDSVHVSEPRYANSGIPQGVLIRRHRIPKEETPNSQHFIVSDFNVDKEVTFYARTFKIVGCDKFTRTFLSNLGLEVPPNCEFPKDLFETHRAELASRMKATRPKAPQLSLKKFLENDRRVLRFYCVWDDSNSMFGDMRHMIMHYYLSDDTIEIRENIPVNAGRESNTLFLKRSRLPKRPNVRGGPEENPQDYYSDKDLMIGGLLHLYGRPFIICDCDEFTKEYYYETYGVESFDPVRVEEIVDPEAALDAALPPPKRGPIVALAMEGVAAVKDFRKLIKYDGVVLRFSAKLVSNKQVDRDRKFVISYSMADDGISIFEPHQRNSGIVGGKFLEKAPVVNPATGENYTSKDLYVGAELVFHSYHFKLVEADEYAKKYMKAHPEEFPLQAAAIAS